MMWAAPEELVYVSKKRTVAGDMSSWNRIVHADATSRCPP